MRQDTTLQPVKFRSSICKIAEACGYAHVVSVSDFEILDEELNKAKLRKELSLIEVKCSIGARADLGRPTTALKNKEKFVQYLNNEIK